MATNAFKTPGLIRAGFAYQDLVAIESLINFYRDRTLYQWVKVDAEESEFRAVDDVVACLPDGRYDLTQVKFTADPSALTNRLSWDWLTATTGKRGHSLLEKWSKTTLDHIAAGSLSRAMLKTDRIPDKDVAACLTGPHIHYESIPPAIRSIIDVQIGSAARARAFFAAFEFVHSCPHIDEYEEKLWARLAADTDRGGWAMFRLAVQTWASLKNQPGPDGRIRYVHLRQAFSVERPRPIPQGFEVPPGYRPPDSAFDKAFRKRMTAQDGVTVLWGPPGRGKSTYLSHCVSVVDPKLAVCIRHHYFLSLDDRSEGRFHYQAIARSFEHQLQRPLPEISQSRQAIGELIATAARALETEGRRLIVVIDGLDHVWRENRDHEQMEEVFNALLPLPPNVHLVVGTQKIATEHLPARLVATAPVADWQALPLMTESAVRGWIELQDKAGRLDLDVPGHGTRARTLTRVAKAFFKISKGLPLHLIYSFEATVRAGLPISPEAVRILPPCPTGDIRDYYSSFWIRLTPKAKALLHVLAGLKFSPPPFAMTPCFGDQAESLIAVSDVSHLLDYRETEVRPFHGSLFAFLQDMPEHKAEFQAHAPVVLAWLETEAPAYWRWAWLWVTRAQLGDPSDLVNKPDRQWAIDFLARGYPIEQLIAILDHAETHSFAAFNMPRTLELRCLKTRALNGPEFQAYETWPLLPEVAIRLSGDASAASVLQASLPQVEAELMPFIVRSADPSIRARLANRAIRELNRRITSRDEEEIERSDRQQTLAETISRVVAHLGPSDSRRLISFAKRASKTDALVAIYAREALLGGKPDNAVAAGELYTGRETDREILAALCLEGLSPASRPALKARSHPALRCLALLKGAKPGRSRAKTDVSGIFGDDPDIRHGLNSTIRDAAYNAFFNSLARGLAGKPASGSTAIPPANEASWLGRAVRAFEDLAQNIADQHAATATWPTLANIYHELSIETSYGRSRVERRQVIDVRLALQDISLDLCLLGHALNPNASIQAADLAAARVSDHWLETNWLELFCDRRLRLHSKAAARILIEARGEVLDSTVSQYDERTTEAARLALFAIDHDIQDLATRELGRALDCLLGYGYRKDPFAFEVLESIELLAGFDSARAASVLLDLAGVFESITEYTDGDETNHAREEYYELLARLSPDRVPACYAALTASEDWTYAEALITAAAVSPSFETPAGQALLESFLDGREGGALSDQASPGRPIAVAARETVEIKVGRGKAPAARAPAAPSTASPPPDGGTAPASSPEPTPDQYPPERLRDYLRALEKLRDYERQRVLVSDWLLHWEKRGKASEGLAALQGELSLTRPHSDLETAFAVAYEVSARTEGRTKAFDWLVRAHIANHGWQRWFSSRAQSQERLKIAAQVYPTRWQDFITATSQPILSRREDASGVVIGLSRLVYFLAEVGETALARTYILTMVAILKAEVSNQPLVTPTWAT